MPYIYWDSKTPVSEKFESFCQQVEENGHPILVAMMGDGIHEFVQNVNAVMRPVEAEIEQLREENKRLTEQNMAYQTDLRWKERYAILQNLYDKLENGNKWQNQQGRGKRTTKAWKILVENEPEIYAMLKSGESKSAIARKFGVSEKTVRRFLK